MNLSSNHKLLASSFLSILPVIIIFSLFSKLLDVQAAGYGYGGYGYGGSGSGYGYGYGTTTTTQMNCLLSLSSSDNEYCWVKGAFNKVGPVTAADTQNITLASTSVQKAYTWQDITTVDITGKYVVMVAWASAEVVRTGSITGVPYLYGYQMNGSKIVSYLQNSELRFNGSANSWDTVSAIFPISQTSDNIRLFWKQGLKSGEVYDGSNVYFEDTAVYIADTEEEAENLVTFFMLPDSRPTPEVH